MHMSQYKYRGHRLTSCALKDVRLVDWAPHFIFSSGNHVSASVIQTFDLILFFLYLQFLF